MNNEIKAMYDNIHMDEGRKDQVRLAVMEEFQRSGSKSERGRRPFFNARRGLVAVAASFVMVFGGGLASFNVTAASIVYASESEMELSVNCWNQVIGVNALNESGQKAASELDLKHRKYSDAVEIIHEYEVSHYGEGCASSASVTVNCRSEKRCKQMNNLIENCQHKFARGESINSGASDQMCESSENNQCVTNETSQCGGRHNGHHDGNGI